MEEVVLNKTINKKNYKALLVWSIVIFEVLSIMLSKRYAPLFLQKALGITICYLIAFIPCCFYMIDTYTGKNWISRFAGLASEDYNGVWLAMGYGLLVTLPLSYLSKTGAYIYDFKLYIMTIKLHQDQKSEILSVF
jgi:hypothetical protein